MEGPHARVAGRPLLALVLVLTLGGAARPAPAGAQVAPHGMPPAPRPLHERLAASDVVALGTVDAVEPGRFAVRDAVALRGDPGARFRVKRAPSASPELAPGDRVLWLLRGAREPYVLVDEPREVLILEDPQRADRVAEALRGLDGARSPGALRAVYLTWLEGDDDGLREHAVQALSDRGEAGLPLSEAGSRERARAALDPSRPAAVRRASARVAAVHPAGLTLLLAGVARPDVDPRVASLALGVATLLGREGLAEAVVTALDHPEPAVREAALGVAPRLVRQDPRVRDAVRRVAQDAQSPELRRRAEGILGRRK